MNVNTLALAVALMLPGYLRAQTTPAPKTGSAPLLTAAYTLPTKQPLTADYRFGSPGKKPARPADDGAAFRIGIRGGANYVLPLEEIDDATYRFSVGYLGGLVFNVGRGMLSFQPEVNYSQLNVKAGLTFQGTDLTVQGIANRIEVPLLVKASFGDADGARFFVNAGPYGAYLLNGRVKANLGPLGNFDEKLTYEGTEGRISYGVAGGLGVAIKAGPGHLTLEGRALYELGDNANDDAFDPNTGTPISTDATNTKSLVLQASLGYLIPIGGR